MATDIRPYDDDDGGGGGQLAIEPEIVSYDLTAVTKAEIDIQIATAKRFPRDVQRFLRETETLACRTQDMARSCMYSLPARSGGGKPIVGPSVRLAEIALHCFGNVRATVRIAAEQDKFIVAQFSGIDLERNVGVQLEVRRRITGSNGRRYSDDMIVMTGNAAAAIALRNGVFKLIPAALIEPIFAKVRGVAVGQDVDIAKERAEWLAHWEAKGVKPAALYATLGVTGPENIGVEQIEVMVGWDSALKARETTLAEIFAPPTAAAASKEEQPKSAADELLESIKRARSTPQQKPKPGGNGGDLFKGREPGSDG